MAVIIIHLFFSGVLVYALASLIDALLYRPRVRRGIIILVAALYYAVIFFIYDQTLSIALNIVVNLLFCFALSLFYNASMGKRIFSALLAHILCYIAECTTAAVFALLFQISFASVITELRVFVIASSVSKLLILVCGKVLSVQIRKHKLQNFDLPWHYWIVFHLITLGSITLLYLMGEQLIGSNTKDMTLFSVMILLLTAIIILVLYMYNRLLYAAELKHQNVILLQQNEYYEEQIRLIQSFQQETIAQRHDIKNHFAVISVMLSQNQQEQAAAYIDSLIQSTNTSIEGIRSGNTAVDAVVNSKLYLAGKQHTKVQTRIDLEKTLPLSALDITILLGNLLDNALEACLLLPQKSRNIHISMDDRHGALIVAVSNTYDPQTIEEEDGRLCTSKQEKTEHGIGLNNIKRVVEKYKGSFEYRQTQTEDGSPVFAVQILLYM